MKKCLSLMFAAALAVAVFAAQAAGIDVLQAAAHVVPALADPGVQMGLAAAGAAGITTFVQDGDTLTLTPGAAVSSGQGYLFGAALFGVATADVANGVPGEFITEGVVDIAKTAGLAVAVGDRVFWDPVNKCVNKTVAAQQQVGICTQAALAGDATVRIKLVSAVPVAT